MNVAIRASAQSLVTIDPVTMDAVNLDKVTIDTVRIDSLQWHVETSGQGPLCLLLHGTGASSHTWSALLQRLSEHFTLMCIDLPGHARSRTPADTDVSLPGMARAVGRLLDELQLSPSLMVGHSAGAAIMLELCLSRSCQASRLVSINGALLPMSGIAGWVFSPLARLSVKTDWLPRLFTHRAGDPRQVQRLLQSTGSTIDAESLDHYVRLFRDHRHVAGVIRMMSQWNLERLLPRLGHVQQQVQVIAATGDRTIPLRDAYRVHALLRHSTLDVIESYGHLLQEESPCTVAELILGHST